MSSLDNLRIRFRDQFTPAGDGYVYRKGSRGRALPASAVDRDRFVAGFDHRLKWLGWTGVPAVVLLLALNEGVFGWPRWTVILPFAILWGGAAWHAWTAPHRALDGRAPVAPALSGSEVRRNGLRTLPWSSLALGAALSFGLAVRVLFEPDPLGPGNRGYLVFAAVLLLVLAGFAVAKRRAG